MYAANVFETIMLICFGAAWPASIYKSYVSKNNQGKSIYFLYIVFIGYLSGIAFQFLLNDSARYVLVLFIINAAMVAIDIGLYYRNALLKKSL